MFYCGSIVFVLKAIAQSIITIEVLYKDITDYQRTGNCQSSSYNVIRHPGYLGTLLMEIGAGLAVMNWVVLLALLMIGVTSRAYQIGVEEKMHLSDILSTSRFYIAIGDLLQLQGQEPEALESYALGVEQNVAATTVIYGILGSTHSDNRNYQQMLDVQQAERIYRRLIQRFPNTAFGYYRLIELLVSQNRFDEAIALYQTWIPRVPDPPIINDLNFNIRPNQYLADLIGQKASYLREIGDFDEAAATYREVLEIDSSFLLDRVNLAMVLVEQGDLEAAANEYRQLIAENPNRGTFYIALGNIFECQGYTAATNLAYVHATSWRESELPAYHFLGNFLLEQGRFEEAAIAYRAILEIHHSSELGMVSPEDFQRYENLLRQQRWQEATSLYQELVESTYMQYSSPASP